MVSFVPNGDLKSRFLSLFGLKLSGTVSAARERLGMGGVVSQEPVFSEGSPEAMEFQKKTGVDAGENGFVPASRNSKKKILGLAGLGGLAVFLGYASFSHFHKKHEYQNFAQQQVPVVAENSSSGSGDGDKAGVSSASRPSSESRVDMAAGEPLRGLTGGVVSKGKARDQDVSGADVVAAEKGPVREASATSKMQKSVSDVLTSSMPAKKDLDLIGLD